MEEFNDQSNRFCPRGVTNQLDEENISPSLSGGLYNPNGLNRITFFSSTSSNSSLGSGLSDTNFINVEHTAASGTTTNRFGLSSGFANSENDSQQSNVVFSNNSQTTSRFVFDQLNVYDVDENLQSIGNTEHYRHTYSDNISNDCGMSPYCSIVSFQSDLERQDFCIECRYNHVRMAVQSCSCNCHNESKEVITTPILNFNANNRNTHVLNRPLSSDNYPTPTKHSWNSTSSLSESVTHPALPPLTNALNEQSNPNPVTNHDTFRYFGASSSVLNDDSTSGYDLSHDSSPPSMLDITGDVRTVNFVSHDQSPLRT
ncbi:hypothetical protein MN116_000943 [Schistosoma mekongi]|uniref:Uncharacterized protein n=1 Tax=Schistosoma mekongi TaxID=38744 RepID=A0AAE2D9Z1_SCHME|nr:hypothetical protein MN116_000943 [Schistosoma mekongi]